MGLYKHGASLMNMSEAATAEQTGTSYTVSTRASDEVTDALQSFYALIHLSQSGGATSPTSKVVIETSRDGTNWAEVVSGSVLAADGAKTELKELPVFARYVRAKTILGGGTKPSHQAKVEIVSNASFAVGEVA